MSVLQAAFNSASTTSPCPLEAAKCSAVNPFCKDGGVSRQSGARMLHCCPYRESNTQIEEGGKNQGISYTQPKIITRISCIYRTCDCTESSSCMQCNQTQAYARTSTHKLKTRHKHTHTYTHTQNTYAQGKTSHKHTRKTCPRDTKHTYNDIIPKVWLAAQHRL